ncbi:GNAT family N-acetyltransferase [Kribbella sp. C-35]|uniref:GNAT family N-acetyltransferase n=1 Tax=Kribbella sp. C-35 TaxID=2789276 RepID=UPI003978E9FC
MEFVDGRVVVDGVVVGSAGMRWWDEADGTRLYLLTGEVEAAYQRRGYGRRILAWQEERAREAAVGISGTAVLGTNPVSERDLALVRAAGYEVALTRVRMTMPLVAPSEGELPDGVELRPASALLRANHAALWKSGVREASLWTVLENPTGSVALYERAGYRVVERQPRYRKPIEGRRET